MEYKHSEIEKKWQKYWAENKTFKTEIDNNKKKYYVLDMFPYPSGAGLHVGHPLGYIASDIYARFMRHKGFNVLHPMGYDAFGLPAEQYAIQTGTHPAITTEKNIKRYREQLDKIGFSFDWDREVVTSDPKYYKWTQWVFIQLFNSYYCNQANSARPIDELVEVFSLQGTKDLDLACTEPMSFTADEWNSKSEAEQQEILMNYRLAYLAETWVNWCPALGTVLANDEVINGLSERGGFPVERKKMQQWILRITAYAQRLLDGLNTVDWSESLKEMQRNWIGRSEGATVFFGIENHPDMKLEIFTTRPDTLWGSTFMVLAPEHDYVDIITKPENKAQVEEYVTYAKNRSERERMTEVKTVSGVFTGAYGINPLTNEKVPIWIADYVLSGYGTGAIMAVPGHDSRDFAFARHFGLPVLQVVCAPGDEPKDTSTWEESYDSKDGVIINSGFITGMNVKEAISTVVKKLEEMNVGKGKINYRLRDAIFSRQRYWGEPFPIYYKDGIPYAMDEKDLPLELPEVDKFLPTESGEPPLARAKNWTYKGYPLEVNTMPGFAGSSAYYLRYMDSKNNNELVSKEAASYWVNVDLYLGGDEHASGHLIYSRVWDKFLFDIGVAITEEPYQKLINQGKIQGRSNFVYRINGTNKYVSLNLKNDYDTSALHVDINIVKNDELDIEAFKKQSPENASAEFILEDGKYICGWEIEKMSKSKFNVQNPDDLVEKYGADTLRLYEMFLGPLESHKPWDTNGIEGVFRFLKKLWRLYHDRDNNFILSDEEPTAEELKVLHKTINKVETDIKNFSFNTAVASFMIAVNELSELKCNKRKILDELTVLISPYAPHIAEELWQLSGHDTTVEYAAYPVFDAKYVHEDSFEYPVSFNGKVRFKINLPLTLSQDEVEKIVLATPEAQKWTEGKEVKKFIFVPKRIINIAVV
ncbi:leucine--tRNA ligase [Bacteroidales bacterium OttesenSCG-928-K03]|nr:leucine--tRNA ligase [Odoribacter sp. OttesenSCG-928-L07]MDL2239736.1 leucine--tRNA ligase [Bacteroidales bacterium OttesenSCG-928-L14]MDL2242450.1 leucine--tRNA ligase [Bacteroidales bacterium OttesenSCG-928-K03]